MAGLWLATCPEDTALLVIRYAVACPGAPTGALTRAVMFPGDTVRDFPRVPNLRLGRPSMTRPSDNMDSPWPLGLVCLPTGK